jgi:hypothetical protein
MLRRVLFAIALVAGPTLAQAAEIVRYQLPLWKVKHLHDTTKADTISTTLKKLGCELKQEKHDGHIDLRYRCPEWRELKLDSHAEADKWEKWLKEFDFKTEHRH